MAGPLNQIRKLSERTYTKALQCIAEFGGPEMHQLYLQKMWRKEPRNDSWSSLLTWRKPAKGATKAEKLAYRAKAAADDAKVARKFPAVYGPQARAGKDWMRPKALAFREWCLKKSWRMCSQCGRMVKEKLRGSHLRGKTCRQKNELKACTYCKSHGKIGYWAPAPDDQPLPLQKLVPDVVRALRPFEVHTGYFERAPHGYLVHTDMFRVSLKTVPVEEALQGLPKKQRRKGQKALPYLLQSTESSYSSFARMHQAFLAKRGRAIERGETWEGAPVKRMPANFLETVGLECAVWPHLYWRTDMCETYVRSQDKRRLQRLRRQQPRHRRDQEEAIEDHEEDVEADGPKHQSAKASFLAKVHSCVAGYSSDPQLLHFVWDLWMWSAVGGAKNSSGVHIREALAGKPFSPELWKTKHLALVDLQKPVGGPSLFMTISPFEWSFPYHAWLEDELQKNLAQKLHAPVAETLHLAHVLTQAVKGLLTGSNDGYKAKGDHVFSGPQSCGEVKHWVARLEFQDGKRKRGAGAGKDPQFYHGSGRPHVHILLWLDDLLSIDVADKIKAEMPNEAEEPEMHDLVTGSQLDWAKSGWPQREGPTVVEERRDGSQLLRLHHPSTAFQAHCRAYLPDVLQALHCHTDVVASDGRAMVLKYCASPLAALGI